MFLIAMVARVYKPGCQADYMIVLCGGQGDFKSTVCRVLGGEYFSDNLPDLRSKDASQYLRGLWLIEVSELAALRRADLETLKAFLTRQVEKYRPPYGRLNTYEPRQCLFIGTTNREEFLHDETGNRRVWPVGIGKIDLDSLTNDRDQLFAEAVFLYKNGEHWWPDKEFEAKYIQPKQESHFEVDAWETPIATWLKDNHATEVGICELAKEALGFLAHAHVGTADQRRIANIKEEKEQPLPVHSSSPTSLFKAGTHDARE
jgi:predicted P-loop ATPase